MRTTKVLYIHLLGTFLLILICFSFYQYTGIPDLIFKAIGFVSVPLLLCLSCKTLFRGKSDEITRIYKMLLVCNLISFVMAQIFWGQSMLLSYRASASFLLLLFFFYLKSTKYQLPAIEIIIWVFAGLYVLLWLFALSRFPELTFGFNESDDFTNEARGIARINFIGSSFLPLACFLSLNKYLSTKKYRYILIYVLFFTIIVLQVTRQTIVFTLLVTLLYVFWLNKKKGIYLVGVLMALAAIGFSLKIHEGDNIIGNLIELSDQQEEMQSAGNENVRITEYKYFFTEWSQNPVTMLFGNGMPHMNSSYGKYYEGLQDTQGLYLSDVGYPSMYVIYGLLGLCLYLYLFYKGVTSKVRKNLYYAKMFILFICLSNVSASWYFTADCQVAMALCFYIISRYGKNRKTLLTKQRKLLAMRLLSKKTSSE